MLFRRKRREVPGLNTTSTADISFMLLVFFLVTTSMDTDKGMGRRLPPREPDKQEQMDVDRSKVLSVKLDADGILTIDEKVYDIRATHDIRRVVKEFVLKTGPEHVVELNTDRECNYDTYFKLQNELVRSYRELRDAVAQKTFHHPYVKCSDEETEQINDKYPQRIQEVY